MEPNSGRRSSDREIDPNVEMYVQEVVADTRHKLVNEITVLAASQADAKLQATKEHGEVRRDIQAVQAEVAGLRREIADLTPLRESVEALRRRDEIDDARAETSRQMLTELQKQRTQFRNFMIAIAGLVVTAAGVVVAVLS
jgi:sensor histidine kinase regulating citrate/malate metabolism